MRRFFDSNTEPFLIIFIAALGLSYLSFTGYTFVGGKPVDMFSEVRKNIVVPDKISRQVYVDSLNRLLKNTKMHKDTIKPLTGLEPFFAALLNVKTRHSKVRVAWFGDSMIEGDLVTNDFRKLMQQRFGGNGVGFVPITSPTAQFRGSIHHTFNGWKTYSYHDHPPKGIDLGIAGYVHFNNGEGEAKYSASKEYDKLGDVRLLYSHAESDQISVYADTMKYQLWLDTGAQIHTLTLVDTMPCNKLTLRMGNAKAHYYGIYSDNGSGVYVDNFSFRGNSGIPLGTLNKQMLQQLALEEHYDLIVLNYGLNVVAHNQKNYDWYTVSFRKTLAHLRQSFPNATIVLMSVSDKSYRSNGVYETEPDIPKFVAIQQQMATDNNMVFWNLYEAMGGYNSMKRWVEEKPRLANYDYTHPNFDGAKKIANLFYDYIIEEFNKFQPRQSVQMSIQPLQDIQP